MSKLVKFPLKLKDNTPVRTFEDFRKHFSIIEVVKYHQSGQLVKWLKTLSATDTANQVTVIDSDDPEIVQKLCDIFEITCTAEILAEYKNHSIESSACPSNQNQTSSDFNTSSQLNFTQEKQIIESDTVSEPEWFCICDTSNSVISTENMPTIYGYYRDNKFISNKYTLDQIKEILIQINQFQPVSTPQYTTSPKTKTKEPEDFNKKSRSSATDTELRKE